MKYIRNNILLLALIAIVSSCGLNNGATYTSNEESPWASEDAWYQSNTSLSDDKTDLFYIVSTNVLSAKDSAGNVVYQSQLAEEDRKAFDAEFRYVEKHFSQSDLKPSTLPLRSIKKYMPLYQRTSAMPSTIIWSIRTTVADLRL